MPKIKGRNLKRVAQNKDGSCPKGAKKFRRGKITACYAPIAKPKKR
jgi:hypothetical protein